MKRTFRKMRLKNLEKGTARTLGFFEMLSMKLAGWIDGRKRLLRKMKDGSWQSSKLKEERDAYEEFCANLYGHLKIEAEEEFKQLNILLDRVAIQKEELDIAENNLRLAKQEVVSENNRKAGEENLTETQVKTRRKREKAQQLQFYYKKAEEKRDLLNQTKEEIYKLSSYIKEDFDSICKIVCRFEQRCQRRIDVYWRSAMTQNTEMPPISDIKLDSHSMKEYQKHYERLENRVEMLRNLI